MTAYPAWTPATRPGIVPLRPLSFGVILGRSFSALRQNPRVLLGFALTVQSVVTLIGSLAIVAIVLAAFLRLDTLRPGTQEFDEVMAGSIAIGVGGSVLVSLVLAAVSVIVQGVVVGEVARAVVAEKLTLRALWAQVKPVIWRLVGYTLLLTLVVLVAMGIVVAGAVALVLSEPISGLALSVGLALAAIPLALWLTVKLLLVPPAIILERATITGAIARSWSLTRGRFWSTLGIVVLISTAFGFIGQAVSLPFSLATTAVSTVLSPTGDPDTGFFVALIVGGVLTQVVTVLVQSVAIIVQSTATSLIYVDCRMRREGLDQDLLAYVERRDAGVTDLEDPYTLHIGRTVAPRVAGPAPYAAYPPPAGAYPPPAGAYPPPAGAYPPPAGVYPPYAAGAYPPPPGAYPPPAPTTPAPAAPRTEPGAPSEEGSHPWVKP
ncbi:glycerophosphoryl diester phosphodiesterase membrane domain-containing protein [Microbacterium sp. zg.Y909]|uniref:glycerophosphoryl diester phosphodiesterase membrane domain-containing protein n=1 Tax=Microbacterium sp. zg.Y909 TaxID=2969413 RepID=UPI00214CC3D6|nr:glycerophosphoryl diester phosphodiesterase membrane domain-containing protein [Microbacterium sp. zg.Y909]MCR2827404.1 glycerophosphoryl diester phosphodiesterase membrane domain-containing protein [Microbacterium sp. zg.Y909]